jgi:hypothetical protein
MVRSCFQVVELFGKPGNLFFLAYYRSFCLSQNIPSGCVNHNTLHVVQGVE